MPTIKLTDQVGVEVEVELNESSAIAKYIKDLKKLKLSELKFAALENTPLDQAPLKSLTTGITFEQPVGVGIAGTELKIAAGASGGVRLSTPKDKQLIDPELFDDPIGIEPNQLYLSFQTGAKLGVKDTTKKADFSFGFNANTDISLRTSRLFEQSATGAFPNCVDALKQTVGSFVIPRELADLERMTNGSVVTVEGVGKLKFSGGLNLLSVVNPLASVKLPAPAGELKISSGGSLKVGASFEISGAYQLRLQKKSAEKIRLGFYKRRGTDFGFSITASVGVSAGLGDFDVMELVLKAISGQPAKDLEQLKEKGIPESTIKNVQKVIEAGVSKKLELALALELNSQRTSEAAFLFDLEISKLDQAGKEAVHDALRGDLSAISAKPQTGISLVRSIVTETQTRKHAVKFNLLGIFNSISVSSLILENGVKFEPATGEIIITDKATAKKISASAVAIAADSAKLRKAMAESVILTVAYQCSKLAVHDAKLKVSHSHFELHADSDRKVLKDNLDVFEALGLMNHSEKDKVLASAKKFGKTTFYAATAYDDVLASALFLKDGKARARDEYERAGRKALELLVQSGEGSDARRRPFTDDVLWKEMAELGFANFKSIPALKQLSLAEMGVITTDYTVIMWWAEAMTEMGKHLVEVRKFIEDNPQAGPEDEKFKKLRKKLASKLTDVAANARSEFGDPWGLVAMDQLTGGKADAETLIVGPTLSLHRKRSH
jgi:hypothetical protein